MNQRLRNLKVISLPQFPTSVKDDIKCETPEMLILICS